MSYAEPDASGYTPHPSEIDPRKYAVCPSDPTQELVFKTITAISAAALEPSGTVPERRTSKGVRPAVYTTYNPSQTAVLFEVHLHTNQIVKCIVPLESWRMYTCTSENVRAGVQKAYLNLLQGKEDPVVVKPHMLSLGLLPKSPPAGNHHGHHRSSSHGHGSRHTTTSYFSPHRMPGTSSPYGYSSSDSTARTYSLANSSGPTSPVYYDPYRGYRVQYVPATSPVPPIRAPSKLKKRGLWP